MNNLVIRAKLSRESARYRARVTYNLRNFSKHYAGRPTQRKIFTNLVKVFYVTIMSSSLCISVKSNVLFFIFILAHDLFIGTANYVATTMIRDEQFLCRVKWSTFTTIRHYSIIRNEHIYHFFDKCLV